MLLFAFCALPAKAQTVSYEFTQFGDNTLTWILTLDWIADGTGAVSWNTDITPLYGNKTITEALKGTMCVRIITIPDAVTPPSALYDIVVSEYGGDVMGGRLTDRSDTTTEFEAPDVLTGTDAAFGGAILSDTWTVSVTNAGSGGTGTLILIFAR